MHNLQYRFFFDAEDGIRDTSVTGVQTCALPIYLSENDSCELPQGARRELSGREAVDGRDVFPGCGRYVRSHASVAKRRSQYLRRQLRRISLEIGRASCRERV